MAVGFGVLCSSTLLISYVLLIMMLLDSHCSASRLFTLNNISSLAALAQKNWCTHFWVPYITLLFMSWYSFVHLFSRGVRIRCTNPSFFLFTCLCCFYYFPSVLWHCWLGERKGIRPVKSLVLICWWWWFDRSFARVVAPVVTTTSIILRFNKHRLTQVHLENGR